MKSFFTYTIFFVLFALLIAEPTVQTFSKRNNCPFDKRNDVLGRRTNFKKCSCSVARSVFDGQLSEGPMRGFVMYGQDECGHTTISGIYFVGFIKGHKYDFLLVDGCGNTLHDITNDLDVQLNNSGGTKPFAHKFTNINLDCDDNGLLNIKTNKKTPLNKRTCKRISKREPDSAYMRINDNGDGNSEAKVEDI